VEGCFSKNLDFHVYIHTYSYVLCVYSYVDAGRWNSGRAFTIVQWRAVFPQNSISMCIFIHIHVLCIYLYVDADRWTLGRAVTLVKSIDGCFPCVSSYIFICLTCICIRGCRSVKFRAFPMVHMSIFNVLCIYAYVDADQWNPGRAFPVVQWGAFSQNISISMCIFIHFHISYMYICIRGCRSVNLRTCFSYGAVEGCFSKYLDFHVYIHTYSYILHVYLYVDADRWNSGRAFTVFRWRAVFPKISFSMCIFIHIHMSYVYMYTWMQIGEI